MSFDSLSTFSNFLSEPFSSNLSLEKNPIEKESSKIKPKSFKINICNKFDLFFSPDKNFVSLCPIIPTNNINILFKLYNLDNFKEKIEAKIKLILGESNLIKGKKYKINEIEVEKREKDIKIIDEHFINDCILLSKSNSADCAMNISNKISTCLFKSKINFQYIKNKENEKKTEAKIKINDKINIISDICKDKNEAKLNVLKKFINKFLPEKYAKEIISNILESVKNDERSKVLSKTRYDKYLITFGGDRKLLKKKRNISNEEFNKRLPYYNMLDKDNKDKKNNYIDDSFDDVFFMNTDNLPINEILLGDPNIVDNHLQDFRYTPLKLFEMVRDTGNTYGVDFRIEYGCNNDTRYCHTNEATIFSQKLGIKVHGYGMTKEEAENKCALNCLTVIYKDKFETFYDLHNYFQKKRGKYLDIILMDNQKEKPSLKKKKIEENLEIIDLTKEDNIYENNKNTDDTQKNIKRNENFIDDEISIINRSNSLNSSSHSSNTLYKALSSNDNNEEEKDENDLNIICDNLKIKEKEDEEEFIQNEFFINQ